MRKSLRIFAFLFVALLPISSVFSATWDGGGVDNLASTPANWTGNAIPPDGDIIVFDATSPKDCIWNLDGAYSALTIDGGYAGSVTCYSTLVLSMACASGFTNCGGTCYALGSSCNTGLQGVCSAGTVSCSAGQLICNQNAQPSAEVCDGLDNNCNGAIDEGNPGGGSSCNTGLQGVCAAGTMSCSAGQLICNQNAQPSAEVCDGLDNNCNGQVDEGFKNQSTGKYDQNTACGNCYTDCTTIYAKPNAVGTCDAVGDPLCVMTCNAGYYDLNAVPTDGCEFHLDSAAVYVSSDDPAAVNDATCGLGPTATGGHPCLTITYGIQRAQFLSRTKVLVADGLYTETVTLANGISLLGGHRSDTWERHVSSTLSVIRGASVATHKKTLIADGITATTTVEGFVIEGQSNFSASGNSYAVWIRNSSENLSISNNVIDSGTGGNGGNGTNGSDGQDGTAGYAGQDTIELATYLLANCTSNPLLPGNQGTPGDGGARICGSTSVAGGSGGGATCPNNNEQKPQGVNGAGIGGGGGGSGGYDTVSSDCSVFATGGFWSGGSPGSDGSNGSNGAYGAGCSSNQGSVSGDEWVGGIVGSGQDGNSGGGGGGGGAGGGADVTLGCLGDPDDTTGGSGGGGGSGGCSGTGGGSGTSGGGAFAVFVTSTTPSASYPEILNNVISRGSGGAGGSGGTGSAGGSGGSGGSGGATTGRWAFAMGLGGKGGNGGNGGAGGGGGGGCGGVTYGLFIHNLLGTPPYKSSNTFLAGGAGGTGGTGGPSLGNSGTGGAAGVSADTNYSE